MTLTLNPEAIDLATLRQLWQGVPFLLTLTGIASLGIAWHGWVAGARPIAPKAAATA